jgi:hypothetical protein
VNTGAAAVIPSPLLENNMNTFFEILQQIDWNSLAKHWFLIGVTITLSSADYPDADDDQTEEEHHA